LPGRVESFSILIETENLASADPGSLDRCLATLAEQDVSPERANEVLLLDSGTARPSFLDDLRARYPWIEVARVGEDSDYYDAKRRGAELATGEVVVFCDSDCGYDPGWLRHLLAPFAQSGDVQVVTGETSTPIDGPYGVAMALTYIFPPFSTDTDPRSAPAYDTNNVAFRREFLLRHPIPSNLPMYRGNHVLHARSLRAEGHTIWQQPLARATHPLPGGRSYFFWRFLLLGDEALTIARLSRASVDGDGRSSRPLGDALMCMAIAVGRIKRMLARARAVFSKDPRRLIHLPLAAPIAAVATLLYWVGLVTSLVRPGYLLSAYGRAQPG
jgi:glycosyltransferase involved in cell wall biosynthesis